MPTPIFATKVLQRKLNHNFRVNAVHRGNDYFLRGAVTDLKVSEYSARAEIIGSEIYQAQLNWAQAEISSEISAGCTCPHFYESNFCKHLWSLILELDRKGISLTPPFVATLNS